jgi:hypothetical protein
MTHTPVLAIRVRAEIPPDLALLRSLERRPSMRRLLIVGALLAAMFVGGCDDVDEAVGTLNSGITALQTTSASWADILIDTRDELIKQGQGTLAVEVTNILNGAVQASGVEVRCFTDFLRSRVREDLVHLRATLTHETLDLVPVFCQPNPDSIDMNVPAARRTLIVIDGYNLSNDAIHATLKGADGTSVNVDDMIDVFGYQATVNVPRLPLTSSSTRLEFSLGLTPTSAARQSLPVIQPVPEPVYELATVRVHGTVYLEDVETFGANEKRDAYVDQYLAVPQEGAEFHWGGDGTGCVGGEVNGYLDVFLTLDPGNGAVTVRGTSRFYEGTSCGPTNLRRSGDVVFPRSLAPGESATYTSSLSNGDGSVVFNVAFTNVEAKTSATLTKLSRGR